jgi:hypothetical protein
MDQVVIHITQEDLDHGVRGNCGFCPVAVAAERAFQALAAFVYFASGRCILELGCNGGRQFELPSLIGKFVLAYDNGEKVHPFSFTVDPVDELTDVMSVTRVCGCYASKTGPDESQYKYERKHESGF